MNDTAVDRGRFITVEGQDGAGKTTNLERIEQVCRQAGFRVLRTREPGGTRLGDVIRELVLRGEGDAIDPMAELLLIFAARAQHLSEVIRPALAVGTWVLCDRFTDATYAYQGGGRGIADDVIGALETRVQNELRPDLTLLLDVGIDTGAERMAGQGDPDRFESEATAFKRRVRSAYLARAQAEPARFRVVDAERPLVEVERDVEKLVTQYIEAIQHA